MKILHTISGFRIYRRGLSGAVGFVPTMGALHAGHLSLVKAAASENGHVAVSIFVNPTQFGPNEDLSKYPRTFEADCAMLVDAGVTVLFAPSPEHMYPEGFATTIDVGPVGTRLDGASRPGHFGGVATVVAKLFQIVQPDRAYFGQKDAAQVAALRRLVADLSIPVDLVVCPIVREPDGLAMSSRNRYLSPAERVQAKVLSRALEAAQKHVRHKERKAGILLRAAFAVLQKEPGLRLDYLELVDPDTLAPIPALTPGKPALLAVAGWVGTTRLIDNALLTMV
jgi:pantoate--beta-alanine ligase